MDGRTGGRTSSPPLLFNVPHLPCITHNPSVHAKAPARTGGQWDDMFSGNPQARGGRTRFPTMLHPVSLTR